jgi:hypothetical protein
MVNRNSAKNTRANCDMRLLMVFIFHCSEQKQSSVFMVLKPSCFLPAPGRFETRGQRSGKGCSVILLISHIADRSVVSATHWLRHGCSMHDNLRMSSGVEPKATEPGCTTIEIEFSLSLPNIPICC